MECSWRALGGVLEVSWRLLEGSWTRLEAFWQPFGGVLKACEGFLDAPESILEASGDFLFNYARKKQHRSQFGSSSSPRLFFLPATVDSSRWLCALWLLRQRMLKLQLS